MVFARPLITVGLMGVLSVAAMSGGDANAQQIFRFVGPDGRVTFSDKPPAETDGKAKAAPVVALPSAGGGGGNASLPFELRQASSRFPVTLYSGRDCAPCASGRALLSSRGIPFSEKTVTTNQDIDALKRMVGAPTLPLLTIGGQQLKGYSDAEWNQFLDAAGYPKTSQLPAGYAQAPAAPLVAVQDPAQARVSPAAPAESPSVAVEPAPPNPSGIRF